ncbi:MAG: hypothetical protein P8P74_08475 [Crocinitomicaceae bacterium]|nr:hypothetical protein [Crocinitomicaceae bacterium]
MKTLTLFATIALTCALFSCQSEVDKYQAQKEKHFGKDYYTTITFENDVKVDETTLDEAVIDEGNFYTNDTVIEGTKYRKKYKYLLAITKADEPMELLMSGPGIEPGQTPQYMTIGQFAAGSFACVSLTNIISGNVGKCFTKLIIQAQNDCCFLGGAHCWIECDQGDPVFNDPPMSQ